MCNIQFVCSSSCIYLIQGEFQGYPCNIKPNRKKNGKEKITDSYVIMAVM